jgi:hypothetical protein
MSRPLSKIEHEIVLKLVGNEFPQLEKLKRQLSNCNVTDLADGKILEFEIAFPDKFKISTTLLGEGSIDDIDGVPIVLAVLQKDGCIWRLDIARLDGGHVQRTIKADDIRALGYGNGLTFG